MKKFLGLVLASALCFVITAKASAQDYMGPKFKVSLGGVTISDLNKVDTSAVAGVQGLKTSGFGGGIAYSVMPSDKSDIRLNVSYFTASDWKAWTYGADYIWKFGTPATEGAMASTGFYAGLGANGINVKVDSGVAKGSESWYGGDIVAGVDINTNWNIELKYTLTNSKDTGGGTKLKANNFQYTVGYSF